MQYNLKHIYYALQSESTGTPVYSGGRKLGDSVSANVDINSTDSPYYAEGKMRDNVRVFTGGTIGVSVANLDAHARIDLFGRHETTREITVGETTVTISGTKGNGADEPGSVGVAFVEAILDNEGGEVTGWYAVRYNKLKFTEPSKKSQQNDPSPHFDSPVTNGTIMEDINGEWYEDGYCATEEQAVAWVKSALNITE